MPSIIRSLPVPRYASSIENTPGTIVDVSRPEKRRSNAHRHSMAFSIASSRSSKSSLESVVSSTATLDLQVESPPVVCYGPATESSGALLSGMLWLNAHPWDVTLESLKLSFQSIVTTKRPVVINCPDCTSKTTDLQSWEFISGVHQVTAGNHNYPFSYLVPGHIAPTTVSTLGSIKYRLHARGVTADGEIIQATRDIPISRAILEGADRNSLRIFPPTNLSANLVLPSVIHRGGSFPVEMRVNGIGNREHGTRWRLRKVNWRIEEKSKIISPACPQHAAKIGGEGKGVQYEDIKIISASEMKSGWKSDFNTADGRIEFLLDCGIPAGIPSTDDVDNGAGFCVSHNVVIELVVSEEYVPRNTKMVTPTGAARVLRMQFAMTTTARSGMGISWEDECPPLYENIPSSPPTYNYPPTYSDSDSESELLEGLRL